jgi:hypothetical protein
MKLPKELRERNELTKSGNAKKCSIKGCNENAIRSLSENAWKPYLKKADLMYETNKLHKIYLCKAHYNQSNKFKKSQDKIYQKKGFLENSSSLKTGKWDLRE